jgi:hypothetical protein
MPKKKPEPGDDCIPRTKDETVIELVDGPDHSNRYTFFMYWIGKGHFTGVRGQIFKREMTESDKKARMVDHRPNKRSARA